jgi:hypothetical protein
MNYNTLVKSVILAFGVVDAGWRNGSNPSDNGGCSQYNNQNDGGYVIQSNDHADGSYIAYDFGTQVSGQYSIFYILGRNGDRPIVDISEVTTSTAIRSGVDTYCSTTVNVMTILTDVFIFNPGGGSGTLKIRWMANGKNGSSSDYFLPLISNIELRRVG